MKGLRYIMFKVPSNLNSVLETIGIKVKVKGTVKQMTWLGKRVSGETWE